ncbi:MAG: hypothetical protein IJB94_01675 [Clostridia bacterium]|nr:hypothetical protein [Clostridia bacterium]
MKQSFLRLTVFVFAVVLLLVLASCNNTSDNDTTTPADTTMPNETTTPEPVEPENTTPEEVEPEDTTPEEREVWLPYFSIGYSPRIHTYSYEYDEYGNVIKLTELDLATIREYDKHNNVVKEGIDYGSGVHYWSHYKNTYDEKGNLVEVRISYDAGGEDTVYTYEYDEQNRVTIKKRNGEAQEQYIYNADGSYKKLKDLHLNFEESYELYDKSGKMIESNVIDLAISKHTKTEYSYDDDGKLIESIHSVNGEIEYRRIYEFDEYGNNTKVIQIRPGGDKYVLREIRYQLYTIQVR